MKLDKKIKQEIKQRIGQIIRQEIGKKLGQEIAQKSRQKYSQRRAGRKKKWTKSGQKRGLSNTPLFSWTHNELTPRLTSDIFRKNVIFPKPDQYSFIEPDHDDRKRMGMKVNIVY